MAHAKRAPIVQERTLAVPVEAVFAAWSDPDSLAVWMCPSDGMQPASVELDFRPGGRFQIVMHGDRDYAHHGEYLEIDPPSRLVFTWHSEFVPAGEEKTRVTVEIAAAGPGRAHLRIIHDELPDTDTYDGHVAGWGRIADELARHLEATGGGTRQTA